MTAFGRLFVPEQLLAAVSDQAWFEAMLEFESALARAEAAAGIVPAEAAEAIAGACRVELYDLGELLEQGRAVGNPAEPLVRALRERVGGDAGRPRAPGRDEPGCDRHRCDADLATRARSHQRRARSRCSQPRGARRGASLDADGRPYPPPAGRARDVRLQGGRLARGRARGATPARARAYRAAGGAARRCGRDARGSRGARSRGATSPGGGARAGRARAAMAHEPDTSRRAGGSARHVCVRAREDRSRSRAARADGGGGSAGADGRRIVDDAPEAESRTVGARAGVRGAGERLRVRACPLDRPGARARGGCVARRVGGALRSARVHGRGGVGHRRGAGWARSGRCPYGAESRR